MDKQVIVLLKYIAEILYWIARRVQAAGVGEAGDGSEPPPPPPGGGG